MRQPKVTAKWSTSFNMTAMIDVIFLLIIFFLCVNQYQKADQTDAVKLPDASSDKVEAAGEQRSPLVLNVQADGAVAISGRRIEVDELEPLFERERRRLAKSAKGKPASLEVWIRADRVLPYRYVEPILKSCAQAGVWKVAFKVKQVAPPPGRDDNG